MFSTSYEQQERERARAVRQRQQGGQGGGIPHEWRPWLHRAAPSITVFADRHIDLWSWFEQLTPEASPDARSEATVSAVVGKVVPVTGQPFRRSSRRTMMIAS